MERTQELRIIQQLAKGIKIFDLLPRVYHNSKVYYELKLPQEKITICLETEASYIKSKDKNISFKIIRIYQTSKNIKLKVSSNLIGKILKLESFNNFYSKVNPLAFSLTGLIILQ